MGSKNALIMLGEAVVGAVAGLVISHVVENSQKKATDILTKNAKKTRPLADQAVLDSVANLSRKEKAIKAAENQFVRKQVDQYKELHNLKDFRSRLYSEADTLVNDFKAAVDLEGNSERIRTSADNDISKYREQISFDSKMAEFNSEIDKINYDYNSQKTLIKLASSDEETEKKLIKTAKKTRNEKLDAVASKKHMLQERMDRYEERARSRANAEIGKIEKIVERKKSDLYSEADEKIKKIDNELAEVGREARKMAENSRSEEEKTVIATLAKHKAEAEEILKHEKTIADTAANNMTTIDKVICYLRDLDISKGTVWFFGLAPVVFIVHGITWWIMQVAKVAKAMVK